MKNLGIVVVAAFVVKQYRSKAKYVLYRKYKLEEHLHNRFYISIKIYVYIYNQYNISYYHHRLSTYYYYNSL